MGVWIEISHVRPIHTMSSGHSLYGSVDWNKFINDEDPEDLRHSLYGSVDWNWIETLQEKCKEASLPLWECGLKYFFRNYGSLLRGHSLYGSVDWNTFWYDARTVWPLVTPFMGVWIEIKRMDGQLVALMVTPFMGVWIEITCHGTQMQPLRCHSLYGSVDWNYHRTGHGTTDK